MRLPSIALMVLLVLAWAPMGASAQEATPAAPVALARTNIRYVSPFTPDGLNPGLNVTATDLPAAPTSS